jgi:hypothetical protein
VSPQEQAPDLVARRNLAVSLARLGRRAECEALCRDELRTGPAGAAWLLDLLTEAMTAKDLTLAGEYAAIFTALRWGTAWRPRGEGVAAVRAPRVFLSVPKLRHDIEQLRYLQKRGIFGEELTPLVEAYQRAQDRLVARGVEDRVPLEREDDREIGHVYSRVIHLRATPRVRCALSDAWSPAEVEDRYLEKPPGLVVVDDFLSEEALSELRLFCLESTVWSGNDYGHGRLGASFRDGFNCPLLLQIAEELRARLPRVLGERHPLCQLWGFKQGYRQPGGTTTHADFAAVNVNFWITPGAANLAPGTGGLLVYGVDAPLHWDFETYNARRSLNKQILREQGARATVVPYRQNRAVIFNSDLFHDTDDVTFGPGYEERRINVTMLYGTREADAHHPHAGRAGPDTMAPAAWRSAAFSSARRARSG